MRSGDKMENKEFIFKEETENYGFIPEYNSWVDMDTQRDIVNKLENITNFQDKLIK